MKIFGYIIFVIDLLLTIALGIDPSHSVIILLNPLFIVALVLTVLSGYSIFRIKKSNIYSLNVSSIYNWVLIINAALFVIFFLAVASS